MKFGHLKEFKVIYRDSVDNGDIIIIVIQKIEQSHHKVSDLCYYFSV